MEESQSPKVALLFHSFGAYHFARLNESKKSLCVIGIETSSKPGDYPWFLSEVDDRTILKPTFSTSSGNGARTSLRRALFKQLDDVNPDVVAIPGWSDHGALTAFLWCGIHRRPVVMMSDSTYIDAPRRLYNELPKMVILRGAASALASGTRAKEYLVKLGFDSRKIELGYDVVDNNHFASGAVYGRRNSSAERLRLGIPESYMLFVGRLVEKKNLFTLLNAYKLYFSRVGIKKAIPLLIVGSGGLENRLKGLAAQLDIKDHIVFYGHASYKDLPSIYGLAKFFILPSTAEQWGLVVNEATAAGLPVLVSSNAGSSADLVQHGRNGFRFDPANTEEIATRIECLCQMNTLDELGKHSKTLAAAWNLDRFSSGLRNSVMRAHFLQKTPDIFSRAVADLVSKIERA